MPPTDAPEGLCVLLMSGPSAWIVGGEGELSDEEMLMLGEVESPGTTVWAEGKSRRHQGTPKWREA
jgi:hypothetical protein